jgi:hypothetical protein
MMAYPFSIWLPNFCVCGPGSSVGIATGYGLDGPGIESRWGIFRTCPDRAWAHPASCTMGTGSFPGVESGWVVTLTPHPFLVPRSKNSRVIPLLSLRAFVACEKGETYLLISVFTLCYGPGLLFRGPFFIFGM